MTQDEIVELVAQRAIEEIEARTLDAKMSASDSAQVCREVAAEVRDRAEAFDEEADDDKDE